MKKATTKRCRWAAWSIIGIIFASFYPATTPASAVEAFDTKCENCHVTTYKSWKDSTHAYKNVTCPSCHGEQFHDFHIIGCRNCHDYKHKLPILTAEKIALQDVDKTGHYLCITCHNPHNNRILIKPCEICHNPKKSKKTLGFSIAILAKIGKTINWGLHRYYIDKSGIGLDIYEIYKLEERPDNLLDRAYSNITRKKPTWGKTIIDVTYYLILFCLSFPYIYFIFVLGRGLYRKIRRLIK